MILNELGDFGGRLVRYAGLRKRVIIDGENLTKVEGAEASKLWGQLCIDAGMYASLIKECTGLATINTSSGEEDAWGWALSLENSALVSHALDKCLTATKRTIGRVAADMDAGVRDEHGNPIHKLQSGDKGTPIADTPIALFDHVQFHPKIVAVSRKLFCDGHYTDAIYRAFVELDSFVKAKSGKQTDGKGLMSAVFNLNAPVIKLNSLTSQTDRDEQEGFMHLYMGAMQGIRNPKAHENITQTDPLRTLEYLGFASLLLRRAEEGTSDQRV